MRNCRCCCCRCCYCYYRCCCSCWWLWWRTSPLFRFLRRMRARVHPSSSLLSWTEKVKDDGDPLGPPGRVTGLLLDAVSGLAAAAGSSWMVGRGLFGVLRNRVLAP